MSLNAVSAYISHLCAPNYSSTNICSTIYLEEKKKKIVNVLFIIIPIHIKKESCTYLNSPDDTTIWMIDNPVTDPQCKRAIVCPSARAGILLAHITALLRDPDKTLQYPCTATCSAALLWVEFLHLLRSSAGISSRPPDGTAHNNQYCTGR